jgi:hypothetical protein
MSAPQDRRFRAALVQLRSGRTVAANLDGAEALIRRAADGGADYIQTPENTALMELAPELVLASAVTEAEHAPLERLRALAAELGVWLHIGSLAVRLDEARAVNRSYLIEPEGKIAARYDKLHMFDVDLAGGESYRESRYYSRGAKAVLADLPFGRLGFSICYDLRFPALYRALATAGARDRDRRLRARRHARRVARERPRQLRPLDDRGALGRGSGGSRRGARRDFRRHRSRGIGRSAGAHSGAEARLRFRDRDRAPRAQNGAARGVVGHAVFGFSISGCRLGIS